MSEEMKANESAQVEGFQAQPEESLTSKLERALNISRHLMVAIEQLPASSDRTSAHARAEECMNYVQKLIDEEVKNV